jgi:hypothetical protein
MYSLAELIAFLDDQEARPMTMCHGDWFLSIEEEGKTINCYCPVNSFLVHKGETPISYDNDQVHRHFEEGAEVLAIINDYDVAMSDHVQEEIVMGLIAARQFIAAYTQRKERHETTR